MDRLGTPDEQAKRRRVGGRQEVIGQARDAGRAGDADGHLEHFPPQPRGARQLRGATGQHQPRRQHPARASLLDLLADLLEDLAVEVLLANHAVRNHIRNEKLQQLATEITLGKRQGMIALEDSLARLVQEGAITLEDARVRSSRPEELESLLRSR